MDSDKFPVISAANCPAVADVPTSLGEVKIKSPWPCRLKLSAVILPGMPSWLRPLVDTIDTVWPVSSPLRSMPSAEILISLVIVEVEPKNVESDPLDSNVSELAVFVPTTKVSLSSLIETSPTELKFSKPVSKSP